MSKPNKNKDLTAHQLTELLLKESDLPVLVVSGFEGNYFYNNYQYDSIEDIIEDNYPKMDCKNVYIVLYPSI